MSDKNRSAAAKLFTPDAIAERMERKPQTLRLWRMKGVGPPFIRIGGALTGRVLYPADDFEAWLAAQPRYTGTMQEKAALRKKSAGEA